MQRVPSNVSSSTSVSPRKRSYGNQDPWSTNAEKEGRPTQPVFRSDPKTASDYYHEQSIESSFSARYSKRDDTEFIIGNDETELELSVESRTLLNRVNDQVRKRQKRSSMDVTEDGEKHSMIWGMSMTVTME